MHGPSPSDFVLPFTVVRVSPGAAMDTLSSLHPVVLSLRAFALRRAQFNEFLAASSSLTVGRYFRLMAIATIELLCTVPIATYGLTLNAKSPIYPWISFSDTHFGYSRVDQWAAIVWRSSSNAILTFALTRWSTVLCALVFFAFFGFADEARRQYARVLAPFIALYRRRFPAKDTKQPLKGYVPSMWSAVCSPSLTSVVTAFTSEKACKYNPSAPFQSSLRSAFRKRTASSLRTSSRARICPRHRLPHQSRITPSPSTAAMRYDVH